MIMGVIILFSCKVVFICKKIMEMGVKMRGLIRL